MKRENMSILLPCCCSQPWEPATDRKGIVRHEHVRVSPDRYQSLFVVK